MIARIVIYSLISCFFISCKNNFSTEFGPFQVGYAHQVITPIDTAFIAGHSHNRIFNGVNDDIYVKAAVISNGDDKLAILTFDCIGLLHPQLMEIRQVVRERIPDFPEQNIVMTSTHTHSGPDVVGLWGKNLTHSGVDPEYMDSLIEKSARAIIQANDNLVSCSADYAISEHGHDWVYNISEPDELDRSVNILRFSNQGKNVLTMTNFACHPTFLDAVNDKVSSDYVGGYYERMTENQGGGNLFIQGSIGGWVQPEHEEKTPKQAFFRGEELADNVIQSLEQSIPLKGNDIKIKTSQFVMPLENPGFLMLSKAGVIDRDFSDSVGTEVAYFEIGNASFATHPGETVPELSKRTKALMQNDGPKFIVGLGMDALGYILKPYFFDEERKVPHSRYLCSVSVGPQTEEYIYNELQDLILNKQ
jgi:hypothetical protein